MPLLQNALISTSRSTYHMANGTSVAAPVHAGISIHIQPMSMNAYKMLPASVVESDYQVTVDSGTDIVEGDIVTSITLPDGETPWPGLGAVNTNEYFRVVYTHESSPGPLQHRKVYVARLRGGGPVY